METTQNQNPFDINEYISRIMSSEPQPYVKRTKTDEAKARGEQDEILTLEEDEARTAEALERLNLDSKIVAEGPTKGQKAIDVLKEVAKDNPGAVNKRLNPNEKAREIMIPINGRMETFELDGIHGHEEYFENRQRGREARQNPIFANTLKVAGSVIRGVKQAAYDLQTGVKSRVLAMGNYLSRYDMKTMKDQSKTFFDNLNKKLYPNNPEKSLTKEDITTYETNHAQPDTYRSPLQRIQDALKERQAQMQKNRQTEEILDKFSFGVNPPNTVFGKMAENISQRFKKFDKERLYVDGFSEGEGYNAKDANDLFRNTINDYMKDSSAGMSSSEKKEFKANMAKRAWLEPEKYAEEIYGTKLQLNTKINGMELSTPVSGMYNISKELQLRVKNHDLIYGDTPQTKDDIVNLEKDRINSKMMIGKLQIEDAMAKNPQDQNLIRINTAFAQDLSSLKPEDFETINKLMPQNSELSITPALIKKFEVYNSPEINQEPEIQNEKEMVSELENPQATVSNEPVIQNEEQPAPVAGHEVKRDNSASYDAFFEERQSARTSEPTAPTPEPVQPVSEIPVTPETEPQDDKIIDFETAKSTRSEKEDISKQADDIFKKSKERAAENKAREEQAIKNKEVLPEETPQKQAPQKQEPEAKTPETYEFAYPEGMADAVKQIGETEKAQAEKPKPETYTKTQAEPEVPTAKKEEEYIPIYPKEGLTLEEQKDRDLVISVLNGTHKIDYAKEDNQRKERLANMFSHQIEREMKEQSPDMNTESPLFNSTPEKPKSTRTAIPDAPEDDEYDVYGMDY